MIETRECVRCHQMKPIDDGFYKRKGKLDTVCKDCRRAYGRNYIKTHRPQLHIYELLNRARMWGLEANFTLEDWQRAKDYFGGCCAVCGKPPNEFRQIVADHWYPLTRGHGTVASNIVPLCHVVHRPPGEPSSCNGSKNAKLPEAWLVQRYGEDEAKVILARLILS